MSQASGSRSLLDHFSALADPRQRWRVVYPLPEILLLVLCATLSGMEDFVAIRLWGEERLNFLRRFMPSARGSEERRLGKEFVCTFRYRWSPFNSKNIVSNKKK